MALYREQPSQLTAVEIQSTQTNTATNLATALALVHALLDLYLLNKINGMPEVWGNGIISCFEADKENNKLRLNYLTCRNQA